MSSNSGFSYGFATALGCIAQTLVVIAYAWIGSLSVNWLLMFFVAKTIPVGAAMLIGLIAGEISIPLSIVVYLLHIFAVL
jgi:hypothetical protein